LTFNFSNIQGLHIKVDTSEARSKYEKWHKARLQSTDEDFLSAPWHEMVINNLPSLAGKEILEIATGEGALSRHLAGKGAEVFAADFSYIALSEAQKRSNVEDSGVRYVQADLQSLPFRDNSFDVVVSCETLEHLECPERGVGELVRIARNNAKLYLTIPNYFNLMGLALIYRKLRGKDIGLFGQPIDHPLLFFRVVHLLKKFKVEVLKTEARRVLQIPLPKRRPLYIQLFDNANVRTVFKYFGFHFFIYGRVCKYNETRTARL